MNKVAVFGGLGNQMFQYALAITMDSKGIPTRISTNEYLLNKHYQGFELIKSFDIPLYVSDRIKVASISNLFRPLLIKIKKTSYKNFLSTIFDTKSRMYKEEDEFNFNEQVFLLQDSYLVGEWKSVDYFLSQEKLIREIYNFKKPIDDQNLRLANEIELSNSIAVHVRRGNYADSSSNQNRILLDATDYYKNAFRYIRRQVADPVFYLFSDDPVWVKEHFRGQDYRFVSHNTGSKSYLDMYLMSLCQHFIIANSSFSWWPAWLAENSNKIVLAPNCWKEGCPSYSNYPPEWVIIPIRTRIEELVFS
ncbi:MAG: alpha-1,2-fucosyltransferase [Bacteroidota bacterium]